MAAVVVPSRLSFSRGKQEISASGFLGALAEWTDASSLCYLQSRLSVPCPMHHGGRRPRGGDSQRHLGAIFLCGANGRAADRRDNGGASSFSGPHSSSHARRTFCQMVNSPGVASRGLAKATPNFAKSVDETLGISGVCRDFEAGRNWNQLERAR